MCTLFSVRCGLPFASVRFRCRHSQGCPCSSVRTGLATPLPPLSRPIARVRIPFRMKPHVTIVIVVWNGIEDTLECLRSLESDVYPNREILVVDNGSTDGTAERIREEGFLVRVVQCALNLGFTGGNNVGLAEAQRGGSKYAFLLNNDTAVEPDALTLLVEAAEGLCGAALLSPVVHYYDTPAEVWFSGAKLSLPRGEALHHN